MGDRIENTRAKFVERKFKAMLAHFPTSYVKNGKHKVGEYVRSLLGMDHDKEPPARPWPIPSLLNVEKQLLIQDKLDELFERIIENGELDLKADSVTNQNYVYISFRYRDQLEDKAALLSHSIIEFGILEQVPVMFDSPEDDLIDARLAVSNVDNEKRAVLCACMNGKNYYFELDEFCMLSLVEKSEDMEKGVLTVFNRKLGVLYNEFVEGSPDLKHAELSFSSLLETEKNEETEPCSAIDGDSTEDNTGR